VHGQRLIEEAVVAIEEVHEAGITLNQIAHEHPRLGLEGLFQALGVVFLELVSIWRHAAEIARIQPAIEKAGDEGVGARALQHFAHVFGSEGLLTQNGLL